MAVKRRYLVSQVRQDLARKMVFVAGPRQVGKTTLALGLPGASAGYLSWDVAEHRERILKRELPPVISIAGRTIEKEDIRTTKEEEPSLNVISNSSIIMKELGDIGILPLKNGTINGIPGILLNEANWKNIDVVIFVVDVISGLPNFRAAANVVQAISKIVPEAYCEIQPLIKEAENIENNLKMINSQSFNKFEKQMYR